MKYLVLARRYRPQTFRDVVGQEAVITTLKNALSFDRVAHAYLFSGSRGIGKTTLARIFAKALNCQSLSKDHEPCNQCPSCLEILSGQSLDVIEIDGASNRGIDDIRQLNETIGYAPSHGKYKIYIIDEVHMLTKEAFNALLKTLEEPPERAKFFFATTEPHKVLPTIISRCQRFDLQRLSEAQIHQKLVSITTDLHREASQEAIHLISQFAEGSLRDAESLLDQILCFTDEPIREEHVRNILGLVSEDLFLKLDTAFSESRLSYAFELVDHLFQMGKDLGHFTEQLIQHYRRLTIVKTLGISSLHLSGSLGLQIEASAKRYTQYQLFYILEILLTGYADLQKSSMQRVTLESLLLTLLRSKNRIPVEVLVKRLSELEQTLTLAEPSNQEQITLNNTHQPSQEAPILESKVNSEPDPSPKIEAATIDLSPNNDSIQTIEQPLSNTAPMPSINLKSEPAVSADPAPSALPNPSHIPTICQEEQNAPQNQKDIEPSTEKTFQLKPIPFHPTEPIIDTLPNALPPSADTSYAAIPSDSPLPFEKKIATETPPLRAKSALDSGHFETLMRFAAVELEGTIHKN